MLVLIGIGATAVFGSAVHARTVLNIGLVRFEAIPMDNQVRLEWDVETEVGTAGYKIKRGQNGSFAYLADPDGGGDLFIIAEGGPAQGHSYMVFDNTAVNGATYTYQLFEITTSNSEDLQDETTVTVYIEPTNTPITYTGGSGNNNPGGTGSGATPTSTTPPTATSQPGVAPTNLPPPTVSAPTPLPSATSALKAAAQSETGNADPPAELPDAAAAAYPSADSIAQLEVELPAANVAGVQVAQAQEEPTAAYPAPSDSNAAEAPQPAVEGISAPQSATEPGAQVGSGAPVVIGAGGNMAAGSDTASTETAQVEDMPSEPASSRLLLWAAFIVALGIFTASVVGAIILYTRRPPAR